MKAHNWLEALPVIAISAETREDNIGLAYELGVSDYFKRPFDISAVRRRVRNTIALYDKISGNLQDAVGMLSAFFLRILKINLTTDSYWVLKNSGKEEGGKFDRIEKFSERLKAIGSADIFSMAINGSSSMSATGSDRNTAGCPWRCCAARSISRMSSLPCCT